MKNYVNANELIINNTLLLKTSYSKAWSNVEKHGQLQRTAVKQCVKPFPQNGALEYV